jgi:UDP-N-acetylglucosamine--dolichyl-phosphate N-acetylglucosaminephosphotransferase
MTILLGFIDDVVDLRWRDKLIVPTIASFPLLVAYSGVTSVKVPVPLVEMVGS